MVAVVGVSEGNEGNGAGGEPLGIRRIWQWAREGASPNEAASGVPPWSAGMIAVVVGGAGLGVYALYGGAAADDGSAASADGRQVPGSGPTLVGDRGEGPATAVPDGLAEGQGGPGGRRHGRLRGRHRPAHRLHQGRPHHGRHPHPGHGRRREDPVLRQGHGDVQERRQAAGVRQRAHRRARRRRTASRRSTGTPRSSTPTCRTATRWSPARPGPRRSRRSTATAAS